MRVMVIDIMFILLTRMFLFLFFCNIKFEVCAGTMLVQQFESNHWKSNIASLRSFLQHVSEGNRETTTHHPHYDSIVSFLRK
jgi:hypothetical protein